MELVIYESDWDEAVRRVKEGCDLDDFDFNRVDPDHLCANCALAVAGERLFGKPSYVLDQLDVDGHGSFTGPGLHFEMMRFDHHLQFGRLKPCAWPIRIPLTHVAEAGLNTR